MKKIYIFSIVCLLAFSGYHAEAQDTIQSKLKGWSAELNFNPFNGSLSLNNANGQIKFRKFYPNGNALRVAFTLGHKNIKTKLENVYGSNPIKSSDHKTSTLLAVNIGVEKHYKSTPRLSPYIGWEAGIGFRLANEKKDYNSSSQTIKGAWLTQEMVYNGQNYYFTTNYVERGFFSLGAKVLTGFDFYMAKNFYFGYEVGFGIEYTRYSKITIANESDFPGQNSYPDSDESAWNFGPNLVNGIRVGYIF